MERYYRIAGVDLSVNMPEFPKEEGILSQFRVDCVQEPHCFDFRMKEALKPPCGICVADPPGLRVYVDGTWEYRYTGAVRNSWENAHIFGAHRGKEHQIDLISRFYPRQVDIKAVLNALTLEHLVAHKGGFLLHASYIAWKGKAILFTAPSGTGKSTQADLWKKHRGAEVINGDKAVVRITENGVEACGIPYSGSSGICKNVTLPLAAVVYLSQAPQTSIQQVNGFKAYRRIWEGCSVNTWNQNDVAAVSKTVQCVLQAVPVYHLACTPDESAVTALEQMLKRGL